MSTFPSLETLYMPSKWCFRRCSPESVVQKHVEFVTKESAITKQEIPYESNIRYGSRLRQLLHIFTPSQIAQNAIPTLVYIHGGYWQSLDKEISCYCVKPFVKAGIRVIVPDYDLAPAVPLNIIMREIEELVIFLNEMKITNQWGPIWMCGHSAGAHLAASILQTDLYDKIAGFILISGIYNLVPLLNTSVNDLLNLTLNGAIDMGPVHSISNKKINYTGSIMLVVGEFDSPAFQEQQLQFAHIQNTLHM